MKQKTNLEAVRQLFLLLIFLPCSLFSQTLDDFKACTNYDKGPELIPFSGLRSDATSVADEVQRRKDELTSATNIGTMTSQKGNLLGDIDKANKEIARNNREKDDFTSKNPQGSTSFWDNNISDQKKIRDEATDKLNKLNDRISRSLDIFDRLTQARGGLREKFEDALKKLEEAYDHPDQYLGSNPTDENRKLLKEYSRTLEDKIKYQNERHSEQESKNSETRKNLEELLKKNSI